MDILVKAVLIKPAAFPGGKRFFIVILSFAFMEKPKRILRRILINRQMPGRKQLVI